MASLKKEIKLEASAASTSNAIDFVNDVLTERGFSMRSTAQMGVAVDEIFSNIVNYGYDNHVGEVIISLNLQENPDYIELIFKDNGKKFNPLEKEAPDLSPEVRSNSIGGLGIFIVRKTMDKVEYEYSNGYNVFTIGKKLEKQ